MATHQEKLAQLKGDVDRANIRAKELAYVVDELIQEKEMWHKFMAWGGVIIVAITIVKDSIFEMLKDFTPLSFSYNVGFGTLELLAILFGVGISIYGFLSASYITGYDEVG